MKRRNSTRNRSLLLLLMAVLISISGPAHAKPESLISLIKSIFEDCNDAKNVLRTDPTLAALMFTGEGCDHTQIPVPEGFTDLPFLKKDRVEAIMVKPKCICVAFDHADRDGKSAVFDAVKSKDILVIRDLKDQQLDKDISAIDCTCGKDAEARSSTDDLNNSANCGPNCKKRCSIYTGQFNRVDLPEDRQICAMAFDDDDCHGWSLPISVGFRGLSFLSGYRNDIESVMVKPGCVFTGFDHSDKTGRKVILDATSITNRQPLFTNLGRRDLRNDITAVECNC